MLPGTNNRASQTACSGPRVWSPIKSEQKIIAENCKQSVVEASATVIPSVAVRGVIPSAAEQQSWYRRNRSPEASLRMWQCSLASFASGQVKAGDASKEATIWQQEHTESGKTQHSYTERASHPVEMSCDEAKHRMQAINPPATEIAREGLLTEPRARNVAVAMKLLVRLLPKRRVSRENKTCKYSKPCDQIHTRAARNNNDALIAPELHTCLQSSVLQQKYSRQQTRYPISHVASRKKARITQHAKQRRSNRWTGHLRRAETRSRPWQVKSMAGKHSADELHQRVDLYNITCSNDQNKPNKKVPEVRVLGFNHREQHEHGQADLCFASGDMCLMVPMLVLALSSTCRKESQHW